MLKREVLRASVAVLQKVNSGRPTDAGCRSLAHVWRNVHGHVPVRRFAASEVITCLQALEAVHPSPIFQSSTAVDTDAGVLNEAAVQLIQHACYLRTKFHISEAPRLLRGIYRFWNVVPPCLLYAREEVVASIYAAVEAASLRLPSIGNEVAIPMIASVFYRLTRRRWFSSQVMTIKGNYIAAVDVRRARNILALVQRAVSSRLNKDASPLLMESAFRLLYVYPLLQLVQRNAPKDSSSEQSDVSNAANQLWAATIAAWRASSAVNQERLAFLGTDTKLHVVHAIVRFYRNAADFPHQPEHPLILKDFVTSLHQRLLRDISSANSAPTQPVTRTVPSKVEFVPSALEEWRGTALCKDSTPFLGEDYDPRMMVHQRNQRYSSVSRPDFQPQPKHISFSPAHVRQLVRFVLLLHPLLAEVQRGAIDTSSSRAASLQFIVSSILGAVPTVASCLNVLLFGDVTRIYRTYSLAASVRGSERSSADAEQSRALGTLLRKCEQRLFKSLSNSRPVDHLLANVGYAQDYARPRRLDILYLLEAQANSALRANAGLCKLIWSHVNTILADWSRMQSDASGFNELAIESKSVADACWLNISILKQVVAQYPRAQGIVSLQSFEVGLREHMQQHSGTSNIPMFGVKEVRELVTALVTLTQRTSPLVGIAMNELSKCLSIPAGGVSSHRLLVGDLIHVAGSMSRLSVHNEQLFDRLAWDLTVDHSRLSPIQISRCLKLCAFHEDLRKQCLTGLLHSLDKRVRSASVGSQAPDGFRQAVVCSLISSVSNLSTGNVSLLEKLASLISEISPGASLSPATAEALLRDLRRGRLTNTTVLESYLLHSGNTSHHVGIKAV